MKQGGDTNTIAVVDGVKDVVGEAAGRAERSSTPTSSSTSRCSSSARSRRCSTRAASASVLTGLMVLVFLGSFRATVGVFLSIPLSALAALIALYFGGSSINTMILAGFALVFSRLIDNAVIVLENIFRHIEMGEPPEVAAEKGGDEVSLAVLAATLTSSVVFFPVTFLYGVSRFLFSALALAVVLALFASYFVAMTVVPLFCARFLTAPRARTGHADDGAAARRRRACSSASTPASPCGSSGCSPGTSAASALRSRVRAASSSAIAALFVASLVLYPLLGVAFFPRTDAGQFVINLKSPSGSRIEVTAADVAEGRGARPARSSTRAISQLIVSNIGVHAGLLVDLHEQRRPAHRHRAGGAQGETTGSAATSTWRACATALAARAAAT